MAELSEMQAALFVGMSPRLLRWFTSHAPKLGSDRKLPCTKRDEEYFYDDVELKAFDEFLREPWPPGKNGRPPIPAGILDEVRAEAHYQCAVCGHGNDGEAAHIDAVHKSQCNHPENLLHTCPNHHTAYDHGHRVHATLNESAVRSVKKRVRESQERQWRTELRAANSVMALVRDIEEIRKELREHRADAFKPGLMAAATHAIARLVATPRSGESKQLEGLAASVAAAAVKAGGAASEEAIDAVVGARDEFLQRAGKVACPACLGEGAFGHYDVCPECGGDAYMTADEAARIDARDYARVPCPICGGRGTRGGDECPACGGQGTLERRHAVSLDRGDYSQVTCPLCAGRRRYGERDDCPVCGEEGTVERRLLASIDVSRFKLVRCKLCSGGGQWGDFDACPACGGEGQLERQAADEMDWSRWR